MPQWTWNYEALPHQDHKRQGAIMERDPVAVLPRVPYHIAELIFREPHHSRTVGKKMKHISEKKTCNVKEWR
jgi:hypothetical protein